MAKDTNKLRDEEREVETAAAYAGKGDEGDSGDYSMPATEKDNAMSMCQSAVDAAKAENSGSAESTGSGTEEEEEWD